MTSLGRRGSRAALWNNAGNVFRLLLQFITGIALARMLGPEAFGLVAIALFLIGLGQLFSDLGFSTAIIQSPTLADEDVDFLFTVQICIGALMTAAVVASALPLAHFFDEPRAADVVRALAPLFLLRAVGLTASALLMRDLNLRAVQIGTIAGYGIGYLVIGLPLAQAGFGVWSLVVAQLVQAAVTSIVALSQVGRPLRLRVRPRARSLFRFGSTSLVGNLGSWILATADAALVGHMAGAIPLGLYNRAQNLASTPAGAAISGLQVVVLGMASRAQANPNQLRRVVLSGLALVLLLVGPVLLAVACVPETVILAVFGSQWSAAAPLLRPLSLAMIVHALVAILGPALVGAGLVRREAALQWTTVLIMLPLLFLASRVSVEAVAWALLTGYCARLALMTHAVHRLVPLGPRGLMSAIGPVAVVALAAALAAALTDAVPSAASPQLRLLLVMLGAGGGCLLAVFLLRTPLRAGPLGQALIQSDLLPSRFRDRLLGTGPVEA